MELKRGKSSAQGTVLSSFSPKRVIYPNTSQGEGGLGGKRGQVKQSS